MDKLRSFRYASDCGGHPPRPSFRFPELSQLIWSSLFLANYKNLLRRFLMFARNVSVHLKSNMLSEYDHVFESQILPLLRKQKGFRDEITFASPNGMDMTAISLWDNKENAEAYNANTYPEVLKTFAKVIDGTPKVQTCEVVNSTFHNIAVGVPA
jgi:hypothetical protein